MTKIYVDLLLTRARGNYIDSIGFKGSSMRGSKI
jgi:hypothetical protein